MSLALGPARPSDPCGQPPPSVNTSPKGCSLFFLSFIKHKQYDQCGWAILNGIRTALTVACMYVWHQLLCFLEQSLSSCALAHTYSRAHTVTYSPIMYTCTVFKFAHSLTRSLTRSLTHPLAHSGYETDDGCAPGHDVLSRLESSRRRRLHLAGLIGVTRAQMARVTLASLK